VTVVGHGKGNLGQVHIGLEEINMPRLKSIPALLGEPDIIRSMDRYQLQSDTIYNYHDNIASLSWQHQINPRMNSNLSLIYSGFGYKISDQGNINMAYSLIHTLRNLNLKSRFEYFTAQDLKFEFGGDIIYYAGNEFLISDRFKIEAGLRLSGLISLSNGKRYIYADGLPLDVDHFIDTAEVEKNSIEKTYIHPE
jgi:hypothetical protein